MKNMMILIKLENCIINFIYNDIKDCFHKNKN